ncbi:MAG: hypothetical protein JO061_18145, partial [Acidobacteriaceae bacterium]|nr:hypothetical protein [Acidobacteriaceae bacterium]
MIKSLIFVFSLFEGASIVAAQVRLNATAQPATAYAGVTSEAITGSGFPSGPISAENVTVTFSTACNGSAAGTVAASTVGMVIGTTRRVYFTIPKSLPGGKYAVSISSSNPVLTTSVCSSVTVNPADQFVHRANREFAFNGLPFRFGGGNSFELMYSDKPTVDQVLQTAVNNKFRVLRTWGWIDIGNADGSNSVRGKANGFYFQYWNGSAPAYNDGPNGLANLDYTIYRAGQLGLKLIIPFTNNWTDFGGMDQYVRWANGQYHDQFYTDPTIRQWYKNWVSHLVNRVNSITGIAYKNDPTIMMWELAN